ncbi:MAG: hypothetical protein WA441_03155 [Methyloceanibacter sp.]
MDDTLTSGEFCGLLGVSREALSVLVKRELIVPAKARGRYLLSRA